MAARRYVFSGTVPADCAGQRFDQAAARLLGDFSRAQLTAWIRTGVLLLAHAQAKPAQRVYGGEAITLDVVAERRSGALEPQAVAFEVVHEDEHVIVVNKPAGVVVHPGAGVPEGTLANGLLAHRPSLAALPRAGLLHRLDKDTSGLLAVAASQSAWNALTQAMAARKIDRRYFAVAEGVMTAGRDIDLPVGRDSEHRTRQRVREDGRPARTRVRVRQRYRVHTALEATLETGRTHQVRVHLSAIGHPLVGDKRYRARGLLPKAPSHELATAIRGFRRQALHACALAFEHPISGAAVRFESPLPEDMAALLKALEDDARGCG